MKVQTKFISDKNIGGATGGTLKPLKRQTILETGLKAHPNPL